MIPVMTKNEHERVVFSAIKGLSVTCGATAINIAAPLIISQFADQLVGYQFLIFGAVAIILFFSIGGSFALKERVIDEPKEQEKSEHYSFRDLVKILTVKPVFVLFITILLVTTAMNVFNGSVMYYVTYVLGDAKYLSVSSWFGLAGALLIGFLVPGISKKITKKNLFVDGVIILGVAAAALIFNNKLILLFYIAQFFVKLGIGLFNTMTYSISADNVDYVYDKLGIRSAGAVAALNSLVTKISSGLGGAIPGVILAYSGYVANKAQTAEATTGIIVSAFVIPLVLYIIAAVFFGLLYRIPKITSQNSEEPDIATISVDAQ
jgi:Na+/melibiose symporter-like transporter